MFEHLKNSISYVVVGIGRYARQAIYDRLDDKTKAIIICILSIIIQLSKMWDHFNQNEFDYRMPRLILLAVLKRIHEFQDAKRKFNNVGIVAMDISRKEFEDIKRIGKLI